MSSDIVKVTVGVPFWHAGTAAFVGALLKSENYVYIEMSQRDIEHLAEVLDAAIDTCHPSNYAQLAAMLRQQADRLSPPKDAS